MLRILELCFKHLSRSRWGVAIVLGAIVFVTVGIGRIFFNGEGSKAPALGNNSPALAVSVNPSDEDSVLGSDPPPSPVAKSGRAQPEAVAYAFASAWVDHVNVSPKKWLDRLRPNSTQQLADDLNGVDPASVPASKVIGKPELVPANNTVIDAVLATNEGTLHLRLIAPDGYWLVDDIDWAPA